MKICLSGVHRVVSAVGSPDIDLIIASQGVPLNHLPRVSLQIPGPTCPTESLTVFLTMCFSCLRKFEITTTESRKPICSTKQPYILIHRAHQVLLFCDAKNLG